MTRRVVVVGGGITGLATAWYLRHGLGGTSAPDVAVTLVEADDRLGGKIDTRPVAGIPVDVGADAFLARRPEGERLARRLGLGDELVAPATGQAWLWVRGRLRPLPSGTVLGVPSDVRAVARSGVLSPPGVLRMAAEPLLPRRRRPAGATDTSVGALVAARFGRQVADHLVEPLLGGVYAGRADRLSLSAAAPPVAAAARRPGSLTRALQAHRRRAAGDDRPVFLTLAGGLGRLVERLAAGIDDARTSAPVAAVTGRPAGGGTVELADGTRLDADEVVLTLPAHAAVPLLRPVAPDAARLLARIRYASVAVVTLAYPAEVGDQAPRGSGMLVPRTEGRLVKAATWSSRKWPHLAAGDRFLLRASVGRIDDDRFTHLDDGDLVDAVAGEVAAAMGLDRAPLEARVTRWPRGLPQYDVGHDRLVRDVRDATRVRAPWLHLAGAAYDGVGVAPCIAQAEAVVAALSGR